MADLVSGAKFRSLRCSEGLALGGGGLVGLRKGSLVSEVKADPGVEKLLAGTKDWSGFGSAF